MDEEPTPSTRSRRALPLIAAALTSVVVVGLLYVRAVSPTPGGTPASAAVPTLSGPYSVTYDFISPSTGWALVVDYRSIVSDFWIFKTSDGAGHWQQQYQGTVEGRHAYIHFFDALNGYAYAGIRLYRSTDGGTTWEFVSAPASAGYPGPLVTFASAKRGWALDYEVGAGRLYSTSDGGTTWTRLEAELPPSAIFEPLDATRSSTFTEAGEGWLGAGYFDNPFVYRTTDGGRSWAAAGVPSPGGGAKYLTTVFLVPGGDVIVFVSADARLRSAFMTTDLGVSWRELTLPPSVIAAGDISIADAEHWWASQSGVLYGTRDAGLTWQHLTADGLPADWSYQTARAIDATHGWWPMISRERSTVSALAMTVDGGAHWKMVNPPQPE